VSAVAQDTVPILEVRGITKEYPGVRALGGVDFDVRPGEVHCLLGPNGAGKSTLIKCVSGAVAPTEGQILVRGEPLPTGEPSESLARGVGTIYQELDLVEDLTVAESIFLGHEPRKAGFLDREKMRRDAVELLRRLEHENIPPGAHVRALRPAAKQVVSIARALSREVRLLIMDEPSAILDDHEVETLFGVVRRLTEQGVGVIYISHRLEEIPQIGDRVTVLVDGRTVATGLPADTPADVLVEKMVGRRMEQLFPPRSTGGDEVLLDVKGLTRKPDVYDASIQVRAGEVLGIGGLVGAGRTELLRMIYGLDVPDSGEVYLDGRKLPAGRADRAIDAGLGLVPEDRKSQGLVLEWDLTKNVSIPELRRFVQAMLLRLRNERAAVREQLQALNTKPDDPDRLARELSGGNQQKVVFARWMMHRCRVLLLDEPTRGVDVGAKAEIYKLIADLAKAGLGVIVVSSEIEELIGLASRVLVMREGRIVAELAGDEATELEILRHSVAHTDTDPVQEDVT